MSFRFQQSFAVPSAFLIVVLAMQAAFSAEDKERLDRGLAIVTKNCSSCHAVDRRSASLHKEAPAFRTLGRKYPVEALEEALGEGIISGHPDMPEFAFEGADVGAIIAYLKSIQE